MSGSHISSTTWNDLPVRFNILCQIYEGASYIIWYQKYCDTKSAWWQQFMRGGEWKNCDELNALLAIEDVIIGWLYINKIWIIIGKDILSKYYWSAKPL